MRSTCGQHRGGLETDARISAGHHCDSAPLVRYIRRCPCAGTHWSDCTGRRVAPAERRLLSGHGRRRLFDIDGVLVTSWQAIPGAAEALRTSWITTSRGALSDEHHHPHRAQIASTLSEAAWKSDPTR